MQIQSYPDFQKFLSAALMDADPDQDESTARQYGGRLSPEARERLQSQIQSLIQMKSLPLEDIGVESNRWFGSDEEARGWLQILSGALGPVTGDGSDVVVKDSNGAVLREGDSVTVIKDLKVKGGSSDLKRGTLVKNIRLTSDPALIECKVNGSVLVLRTEFLKLTAP